MNLKIPHLERILLLTVLVTGAMLIISAAPFQDESDFELLPGAEASRGTDDAIFRILVEKDFPQPNGDHWSVWLTMEEKEGDTWNKTTRDINAQVIFFEDSEEIVILEINQTHGFGFVQINLSYDLPEGEYTVRAKAIGADMDWKKEIIEIPITSRPPKAIAHIIVDGEPVEETTVILDREHMASILFDASASWDPDEGETELITFTWSIGETVTTSSNPSLPWVFTEAGDYLVTLRAEDSSEYNMYSEDTVVVHIEEIPYKPDLDVSLEIDPLSVVVGDPITITVTIENDGNNNTSDFDINYYDGNGIFKFQNIGLIPYGGQRIIEFEYTPVKIGPTRIEVFVDPSKVIDEFDEDNNEDSVDIEVLPIPVPKMIIDDLVSNGSYEVGGLTFITVVIRNSGDIEARNVRTTLHINNELMLEENVESVSVGERTTVNYTWVPKVKGTYTTHVTIWVNSAPHDDEVSDPIEINDPEIIDPDEDDAIPTEVIAAAAGAVILLIAASVALAGVENTKYHLLGSMFVAPLYTRLKKEDTLRHEVRARVYEHIITNPGDSYAHILESLVHHLRTLERERYVKSKKDGKFKRFYPWGTKVGDRDPKFLTDIQMEIVDIIKSTPGVSQANIANSLSKSRQSINYQVKILSEAGLINVIKHGITTRCYVQET